MNNPLSLFDAMCQYLRSDEQTAEAFGDTFDPTLSIQANDTAGNVAKFWSDYADQVPDPYLVFEEIGESYEYMTRGPGGIKPFIATGTAICRVFQKDRNTARMLGTLVAGVLNDANTVPLVWPAFRGTATLMEMRMGQASFVPITQIAPALPSVFNRVIAFEYVYQGFI